MTKKYCINHMLIVTMIFFDIINFTSSVKNEWHIVCTWNVFLRLRDTNYYEEMKQRTLILRNYFLSLDSRTSPIIILKCTGHSRITFTLQQLLTVYEWY